VKRHDTPREVAIALSRHAPRQIRALLDPAVGGGNLIVPLLQRLRINDSTVYCVDSDREALIKVAQTCRDSLSRKSQFIQSDFLSWSDRANCPRFDCVVMNPPFAAKRDQLHVLERPDVGRGTGTIVRHMPLEAAFMCKSIDLLEEGGRLLAVAPCSIVMSESLQWFRDEMIARGALRFVHELPPRTFQGVESRMYLMVFDKGAGQKQISLLNHDLREPERLVMTLSGSPVRRLDFGFVRADINLGKLRSYKWLQCTPISEVAEVIRGDIVSPDGPKCAVHSTDFRNGFWRSSARHDSSVGVNQNRKVRRGDLLMARVGRNAGRSVGLGIGMCGMSCSDCVIIVRPKKPRFGLRLLFALRVLLSLEWAKALVERGTGASYVSHGSLLGLRIPMGVCKRYPQQFRRFVEGERARSARRSSGAVKAVQKHIERLLLESPQ
jgi:tRNA1(Val) A37 N6-methylase TrmN6